MASLWKPARRARGRCRRGRPRPRLRAVGAGSNPAGQPAVGRHPRVRRRNRRSRRSGRSPGLRCEITQFRQDTVWGLLSLRLGPWFLRLAVHRRPTRARSSTPGRHAAIERVAELRLDGPDPRTRPTHGRPLVAGAAILGGMTTDTSLPTDRPPLAERALSQRVRDVPPSGIRRFFDILATMDDVISLGVGEPDFDTPADIVEAGVASLMRGRTHYTSNYGTLELRRALSAHLDRPGTASGTTRRPRSSSRSVHPRRSTSPSGRPAIRATRSSSTSRRTSPTCRRSRSPAASPVRVATRLEDDFALDPAAVEAAITPRTKALFLGYPCNPTGAVLPDGVQDELARIARRARPARLQRRDLRPPGLRLVPPPGVLRRCPECATGRSSWAASARPTR